MLYKTTFILFLFLVHIFAADIGNTTLTWNSKIDRPKNYEAKYFGEMKFPKKYIEAENPDGTIEDLEFYIVTVKRVLDFFAADYNNTDSSIGLGAYLSTVILHRTLRDYQHKTPDRLKKKIKKILNIVETLLSHYLTSFKESDSEIYLSEQVLTDVSTAVYSLSDFRRGILKQYFLSDMKINDYVEAMDEGTLPKEHYVQLVETMNEFYPSILESDKCISDAGMSPVAIKMDEFKKCKMREMCEHITYALPTVAYALSHKTLHLLLRRQVRRCYMKSVEEDLRVLDSTCASMYRETVYIARRGYFARDLFLEQIALCGMLGHEEVFRRHWFYKAASWIDEDGCLPEFDNFLINRTAYKTRLQSNNTKITKLERRILKLRRQNPCQYHPMILAVVAFSHAIRFTLHYLK